MIGETKARSFSMPMVVVAMQPACEQQLTCSPIVESRSYLGIVWVPSILKPPLTAAVTACGSRGCAPPIDKRYSPA